MSSEKKKGNGTNGHKKDDPATTHAATATPGQGWTNGAIAPQQQQQQISLYANTIPGKVDLYDQHRRWIGLNTSWSRVGAAGTTELSKRTSASAAQAKTDTLSLAEEAKTVRALMAQLCECFYRAGWATGTGGGISIRTGGPSQNRPWRVFVAPSGLQKEDLIGDDMFELDMERNVVQYPKSNPKLRQSACTPLWYVIYKLRPTAQAVLHTHSPNAVAATLLDATETSRTLTLTHLEMLKGVGNHAYDDVLELPIIDNRPTEDLLADQLAAAVQEYPKANAVLVRRHGLYVWGDSWEQCKTIAESVDYLLATAVQMKQLGVDPAKPPRSGSYRVNNNQTTTSAETTPSAANGGLTSKKRKLSNGATTTSAAATTTTSSNFNGVGAVDNLADVQSNPTPLLPRDSATCKALLLDIEGCTSSISFVKEVLFPYVRTNLSEHLEQHVVKDAAAAKKLQTDLQTEVKEQQQKADDDSNSMDMDVSSMSISDCVTFLMDRDCKTATLKQLQGEMWKAGYAAGELKGHVYADFEPMLRWMKQHNVPVYIYSSGSVQAQKLLFGHSVAGDVLPLLAGHYDIPTAGPKKIASSYQAIAADLKLSVQEICFCSDATAELVAAREAGIQHAVMTIRPGNAPLDKSKDDASSSSFPAIYSLLQLCGAE